MIDLKRNRSMKPVSHKCTLTQPVKRNGFTLMELMIVLAIVGILSAIAFPSYQEFVRDSKRGNCAGELELLANAMERSFSLAGSYPGGLPVGFNGTCPIDGGTPAYNFAVTPALPNTTFLVSAVPTGSQAADKCGTLTLNQLGTKGMNGANAGLTVQDCW
jgi:type IV pilus assembly protein PilE